MHFSESAWGWAENFSSREYLWDYMFIMVPQAFLCGADIQFMEGLLW